MAADPAKKRRKRPSRGAGHDGSTLSLLGNDGDVLAVELSGAQCHTYVACRVGDRWVRPTLSTDATRFYHVEETPPWLKTSSHFKTTRIDTLKQMKKLDVGFLGKAQEGRDFYQVRTHVGEEACGKERTSKEWKGSPVYVDKVWMTYAALQAAFGEALAYTWKVRDKNKEGWLLSRLKRLQAYYCGSADVERAASAAIGAVEFAPPQRARRDSGTKIDISKALDDARLTKRTAALSFPDQLEKVLYPAALRELQLAGGTRLSSTITAAFKKLPVAQFTVVDRVREAAAFDDQRRRDLEEFVASARTLLRDNPGVRSPAEGETLAYLASLLEAPAVPPPRAKPQNNARPIADAVTTYRLLQELKTGPSGAVRANESFKRLARERNDAGGVEFHTGLVSSSSSQVAREIELVDRGTAFLERRLFDGNFRVGLSGDGASIKLDGGINEHFHVWYATGVVDLALLPKPQVAGFAQHRRTLTARAAARDAFVPVGAPPLPLRSPYIMFAKERRGPLMATLDAPAGSARFGAASTLLGQEWAAEPSPVKRRASEALRDHNDGVATQQAAYKKRRKTWSDAQAAIPKLVASMWRPCQASSRQYPTPLELYAMESSVDAENLLEHVEGLLEKWKGLGDGDKKPFVDASRARADAWRAAAAKASIITDELKHADHEYWAREARKVGLSPPSPPRPSPPATKQLDVRKAEECMLKGFDKE